MNKFLSKESIKQFFSYFVVGGVSALVEWGAFFVFDSILGIEYLLSTVFAFVVSTTTNWFLGRTFTFRNSSYKDRKVKEILLVFLVSAIGLSFNILLMFLCVEVIGMNTSVLKIIAKILATGIVFIWNFISRKIWIYKV